jgi:hypothetical protein
VKREVMSASAKARAPRRADSVTTRALRVDVPSRARERCERAHARPAKSKRFATQGRTRPSPRASERERPFRQSEDEMMQSPFRDGLRSVAHMGTRSDVRETLRA